MSKEISVNIKDYSDIVTEQVILVSNGHQQVFPSLVALKSYVDEFCKHFPDADDTFEVYVVRSFKQV